MTKNIRNFLSKKIKFNHIRLKNEKFEPYKYLVNIKDYNTAPELTKNSGMLLFKRLKI